MDGQHQPTEEAAMLSRAEERDLSERDEWVRQRLAEVLGANEEEIRGRTPRSAPRC